MNLPGHMSDCKCMVCRWDHLDQSGNLTPLQELEKECLTPEYADDVHRHRILLLIGSLRRYRESSRKLLTLTDHYSSYMSEFSDSIEEIEKTGSNDRWTSRWEYDF